MSKKKQLKQKGYALFGCPVEGCLYNHKTEQCRSAFARKGAFWRHLALRIFGQKKCELHQQLAQEFGFPSDALEQPVIYFEYVTGVSTSEDTYLRQREFAQQLSELVLQNAVTGAERVWSVPPWEAAAAEVWDHQWVVAPTRQRG
jgi:hypothetical protein